MFRDIEDYEGLYQVSDQGKVAFEALIWFSH